jgi:hypothetical protein
MSERRIPANLGLHLNAYHTVLYRGVPMWRCQAWALFDYEVHGGDFTVNSGIRRDSVVRRWRGKGLKKGYKSQKELYDGWVRFGYPDWFPANPPGQSSHEGFADGIAVFHRKDGRVARRGEEILDYEWGIDAVDRPGGSAAKLVAWLNGHSYKAERPYDSKSERHHMCFRKSPATNARKRLARWRLTGK